MKVYQPNPVTTHNYNDKCRVCLKYDNEMIDIISSGLQNQLIEVANITINCRDQLPKSVCQGCRKCLEEFSRFKRQAKESDDYLRTLLLIEKSIIKENKSIRSKRIGRGRKDRMKRKCIMKETNCELNTNDHGKDCRENEKNDNLYVIFVSNSASSSEGQSQICIRDLNLEKENMELVNICKSLVKYDSNDHTYPNEYVATLSGKPIDKVGTSVNNIFFNSNLNIEGSPRKNIYNVNLVIYKCNECQESFEFHDLLTEHLKVSHKINSPIQKFEYVCPVCNLNESDKHLFFNHLRDHKKTGMLFVKVNNRDELISLNYSDSDVFEIPKIIKNSELQPRIYKINIDAYKCSICNQLLKSDDFVEDHLKICCNNTKHELHRRYTCPACCETWIDDLENFKVHLISHRKDNIFFIKVDNIGQEVGLTVDDICFISFEKALEIISFMTGKDALYSGINMNKKVVKMTDLFSCHLCLYDTLSLNSLSEHYFTSHGEDSSKITKLCPVCFETLIICNEEESKECLLHFLKHKEEGVHFLKIRHDGTVSNDVSQDSGLFSTINDFFSGKVQCSELEFITEVALPEIFINEISTTKVNYFCDLCNKGFRTKREILRHLQSHVKSSSDNGRDYICEKCGWKCVGKVNYKKHYLTHSTTKPSLAFQRHPHCLICNKTFTSRYALNEHKRHHLNDGVEAVEDESSTEKICEICGRSFSNNSSLAKHSRFHSVDRENFLLKCKICDRSFRRESALERHMSAHLNPNYFECSHCKLPLSSLASFHRHQLVHRGSSNTFDCKVCRLSFLTKDRLTAHQTHTGHHRDRKPFECNVCHEKFFIAREFSRHIKNHPKYKMSECALCGKRLATMQSLMLHLDRHFESNGILCPHCGRQFFEERNYHRHLLTHKGFKPFNCDVEGCKKSFYTYFELNRHKKYHNNTRDFTCPYCPKCFHEANHLKVHIRSHTGERPYTCPHCRKGFATRTRCKHHINAIHQGIGCDLIQSNISKKVAVFQAVAKPTCQEN